jgi:hypothetical protein
MRVPPGALSVTRLGVLARRTRVATNTRWVVEAACRSQSCSFPRGSITGYGVGSSLFAGAFDFTADIVMIDGKPIAKQGRRYRPNERLVRVQ